MHIDDISKELKISNTMFMVCYYVFKSYYAKTQENRQRIYISLPVFVRACYFAYSVLLVSRMTFTRI